MAVIGEIVELLRRWDGWKRLEDAPGRIDTLELRVAELELKLRRAPGEACPRCGELDYRVASAGPHPHAGLAKAGGRQYKMLCGACGFADERTINPK